eukprot:70853-Chlamydomonas_euryale.AAC.12
MQQQHPCLAPPPYFGPSSYFGIDPHFGHTPHCAGIQLLRVCGPRGRAHRDQRVAPADRQHCRRHAALPRKGCDRGLMRRLCVLRCRARLLHKLGALPQDVPLVAILAGLLVRAHRILHRRGVPVGVRARHRHHLFVSLRRLRHARRGAGARAAHPARRHGRGRGRGISGHRQAQPGRARGRILSGRHAQPGCYLGGRDSSCAQPGSLLGKTRQQLCAARVATCEAAATRSHAHPVHAVPYKSSALRPVWEQSKGQSEASLRAL